MEIVFRFIVLLVVVVIAVFFPSSRNLEEIKLVACDRWADVGYECVGYEGFGWGAGFGDYGGARVWHTLKREEAPGVIYTGYIRRWGDEYHIYGPTAVDAIKGGT